MNRINCFKNDKKSKKETELFFTDNDFPDIVNLSKNNNTENTKTLNYSEVTKKENRQVDNEVENEIKPGWVKIFRDLKTGKIKSEYRKNDEKNNYMNYSYDDEVKKSLNKLIQKWNKYKNDFIELYGEDVYEKVFKIPNSNYDEQDSDISEIDYDDNNEEYFSD
jgi:hypothetical protein